MSHSQAKDRQILGILQKKSSGTVVIFDRGDHYKCYGDDALLVANRVLLSEVGIRRILMGSNNVEMTYLNLNNSQYLKVVKDVIVLLRYRLEVYEESDGKFILHAKGVLGNMVDFEDMLANCVELTELSTVMCAHLLGNDYNKENHVCLCFCNSRDMTITVSDVNDSPHFPLVDQSIVSMSPRECALFEEDARMMPNRYKLFEKSLGRANLQKSICQALPSTNMTECREAIRKLLKPKFKDRQFGDEMTRTLYALLVHMQVLDDERYADTFSLGDYGSAGHMYVSNATMQALEVFVTSGDQDMSANGSAMTLHDFVNRCRSQPGKRLLRDWLRRPLFDLRRIRERHDAVEALTAVHDVRVMLHDDLLRRVCDTAVLSRRLTQRKASLQDCYRLYQLVNLLQRIGASLNELLECADEHLRASVRELLVEPIQHSGAEFERFSALIQSTFDVEHCERTGQYRIKPDIDERLAETAEELERIDQSAQSIFTKFNTKLRADNLKMESASANGYYFRLTLKSEKQIRSAPSHLGIKIFETTKGGGVKFVTPALEELNVRFCEAQAVYEAGQAELTKAVISTTAGYVPALQLLSDNLGVVDVITTFAAVAASSSAGYVRPEILEPGTEIFELVECRHPVVEQLPSVQFIPNDIRLGATKDGAARGRFVVLSGANMGGKSTFLRANALAVFMAQMGAFVACSSARFSLIDGIYTRVGANDYQCKGVSTFMAEMVDCSMILETATKNSLVIIDELGRGTSTYDGFGLAWAIAEEIITRVQCFCLFATHFHELSHLAKSYPKEVENFQVETIVDENGKLAILYQVVPGVASRSFGLNVAKLVGFPDKLINEAAEVLKILEHDVKGAEQ